MRNIVTIFIYIYPEQSLDQHQLIFKRILKVYFVVKVRIGPEASIAEKINFNIKRMVLRKDVVVCVDQ